MKDNRGNYMELTTWSADGTPAKAGGSSEKAPTLTVVSHPLLERIGDRFQWVGSRRDASLGLCRGEPLFAPPGQSLGDPLALPSLSRKPILLCRQADGILVERDGHRREAWIGGVPLERQRFIPWAEVEAGVAVDLARRVLLLLHLSSPVGRPFPHLPGLVGQSDAIRRLCEETRDLAGLSMPVLVRGETGTGKELVARALHRLGPRAHRPFVSVNMAALSENLAAAELFGSERGAYSGADRARPGYLRAAHGGVLFLDEIGEAPVSVQVMLLRALETREVTPVGGHGALSVDFRLICATDADLESQIEAGAFKEPLYHRIATGELTAPSLRDRREDFGPLFLHFAKPILDENGAGAASANREPFSAPWLPTELAARLLTFSWPGNVRQLRNVVTELAASGARKPQLEATPRLERLLGSPPNPVRPASPTDAAPVRAPAPRKPRQIDEADLLAAMRACAWEPKLAAVRLGISRASVYNLIRKSDRLKTAIDLSPDEIERARAECGGDPEAMARTLQVSKLALARRLRAMNLL